MTKHQDVNKCRGKEKCKMAALIRQANKRVRNGQQARYKKKERMVEKKRKREKQKTLSEKKEEARNVSEQRDKAWIHVICVHDTINPFSRQQHGRATDAHKQPHTKKE